MKNTKIGKILTRLMREKEIRTAELARRINLPQPTIHRIVTGACEHPHLSSLKPIAEFFSISVEQLKGHDPIPWLDHISKVPLLEWHEVQDWPANQKLIVGANSIVTDAEISSFGFALKLKDASMDPVFPRDTILIADPQKQPKDRSYVIVKLNTHQEPIFRQLLVDGENNYLKPLSPDFESYRMVLLSNKDQIISVVVQARRDCEYL